jgi:hypothetical protein
LKVEIGADAKDLSEDAVHLRNLQKRYTIQRNVATPIQLANTTLGFVGTQEVLKDTVSSPLISNSVLPFLSRCELYQFGYQKILSRNLADMALTPTF